MTCIIKAIFLGLFMCAMLHPICAQNIWVGGNSRTPYVVVQAGSVYLLVDHKGKLGDVEPPLHDFGIADHDYDPDGRVESLDEVRIDYDLDGRVIKIGEQRIGYDLDGRINRVGEERIDYDFFSGKVKRLGAEKVDYDLDGRVRQFGNDRVDYDLNGRIQRIGDIRIDYDLHGRISKIGQQRLDYDLDGRVRSISGASQNGYLMRRYQMIRQFNKG